MADLNHPDQQAERPATRPSPATDPTNPMRQESCGEFVANEREAQRRNDEVGMTDQERAARGV